MLKVYDDLFTHDYLVDLNKIARSLNWNYRVSSNRYKFPSNTILNLGDSVFFGTHKLYQRKSKFNIINECPEEFLKVLEFFVFDILKEKNLELIAIDTNLQVKGQDGSIHKDDDVVGGSRDRTILFYPHFEWKDEWGGGLEIFNDRNELVENILPLPGRIVYFDSSVPHRGVGPNVKNVPRISIAYRMMYLN